MDQSFDPNRPGLIEGEVTSVAIIDPVPVGNLVVDPTTAFEVAVEWRVLGLLTDLWLNSMDNDWSVQVYADSVGAGPETQIAATTKSKNDFVSGPGPSERQYSLVLQIPPNTLEEDSGDVSGVYKLVVTVFLNSSIPGPFDMAGFREGPFIRVETAE
jgi:hypothetical protein